MNKIITKLNFFSSSRFGRLNIGRKIIIGGVSIGLAIMICFSLVGTCTTSSTIRDMAERDLAHITDNLLNLCNTHYEINQNIVSNNLNVADFFTGGRARLLRNNLISTVVENQINHEKNEITIPVLSVDGKMMTGENTLVDQLTAMIGGTVTIFQVIKNPDGLLRVSTSVKKQDGSRAVGTYIPASSQVYRAVINGQIYRGSAFVVDQWYITAYKPLLEGNEIIGAIYVGVKQSELDILKKSVLSVKIGERGFAYIIDSHEESKGKLVIHPSKTGENIYDARDADGNLYIREIISEKNGSRIVRTLLGEEGAVSRRLINYRSIDTMGWIVVAEADYDEMYAPLRFLRLTIMILSIVVLMSIIAATAFFSSSIQKAVGRMKEFLTRLAKGDYTREIPHEDISRSDEFGEMAGMFNTLIINTRELLSRIKQTTDVLTRSIQDLTVSSKEISATSNQQAAAVKEIVATMEDSDALTRKVASRIDEVARISLQTRELVGKGFSLIEENLQKMEEIQKTNIETIDGVKLLGIKIESIWEVVNIINSIADQTKIIAFNAELEAAAAGEAGKNFRIVAGEVRRLADNTVNSTSQIKNKINEIQRSSDSLILASEKGTERISEGVEISSKLREVFGDILHSAEVSASSSEQIVSSVKQQVSAFEQILLTLRQISAGIDDFASSTKATSRAAESLKESGESLKESLSNYRVSQE
jgi:methyl-accepting chemotaxis protein